ncbi:MAG: hypothetical protein J5806_12625 [Lentisphaeria bacterium]|nr:hypothetical protein [Lentisphaeria bacterium]
MRADDVICNSDPSGCPDAAAGEERVRIQPAEITLEAVLELARAVQHCRDLAELNRLKWSVEGQEIPAREAVGSLAGICCDPRRIIALMLHAADNPDWAWVNFWNTFCADQMTQKDMAALRKISVGMVRYHLNRTELPEDAYEFVPENRI